MILKATYRTLGLLIISTMIVLLPLLTAHAETVSSCGAGEGSECVKLNNWINCDTIGDCIVKIVNFITTRVLIPLGVVMIFAAGVMFATAGGAPQKIQRAKATLLWAVIGLAFAFGAVAFGTAFVKFFKTL